MKKIKSLFIIVISLAIIFSFTGCKGYKKPIIQTISPSQTAFLIPLVGDTSKQAIFESETLLNKAKVPSKQVTIDQYWIKTGYMPSSGHWAKSESLIVVERKPVTREWTSTSDSGTSNKNQTISAESKESIGFSVGMNCTAEIEEKDATHFLYRYNNKTLEDIMDSEIRARVEKDFVEECSKYTLENILLNKANIMDYVRTDVSKYFLDRGITITTLGMKDGITYNSADIQKSIDNKFASQQEIITQENENKKIISEAEAKAKANEIISKSVDKNIIDYNNSQKWDGHMPYSVGGNGAIVIGPNTSTSSSANTSK